VLKKQTAVRKQRVPNSGFISVSANHLPRRFGRAVSEAMMHTLLTHFRKL
jgi:hypothetical protein